MSIVIDNPLVQVHEGDALTTLKTLASGTVDCCVTSPPYWGLRDYGTATWEGGADDCEHKPELKPRIGRPANGLESLGYVDYAQAAHYRDQCGKCGAARIDQQMGLESSPFEYIDKMAGVFDEVRRVLKPSGTCWIVIGDSYAGSWGNYSGGKRGNGHQRPIPKGSQIDNPAYENMTGLRPPQSGTIEGIKPKDLCGIPWRLAFALQDRGWYLRQDIIWAKPNPMPESVTDRCTRSHEYVFMLTKAARYEFDADAIKYSVSMAFMIRQRTGTNGNDHMGYPNNAHQNFRNYTGSDRAQHQTHANRRDVWTIQSECFPDAHFATFPTKLVELCIKAGCPPDGVVLDPFGGCGTTGEVAVKLGKRAVLIELNPQYVEMIRKNLGLFAMAQAVGVSV